MARLLAFLLILPVVMFAQRGPLPIIDMHLHAYAADMLGPPPIAICTFQSWPVADPRSLKEYAARFNKGEWCSQPLWSARDDETLMRQSLAILERRNIYGVASGPRELVKRWQETAPHRIIPAITFALVPNAPSPSDLRPGFEKREFVVFGEVINQYFGIAPNDPKFEPYWDMAEELDVPVGIHLGPGPPGSPYIAPPFANYRAAMHSPLLLEPVLRSHPGLRVYAMHAGWPMLDEMIAMLYTYPQLYVDIGVLDHAFPVEEFYRYLKALVTAGFGKRIMFGSDQMVWPQAIEIALDRVEAAPFLTSEQKRDILYNNASRFLRLTEDEIRRHHGTRQ